MALSSSFRQPKKTVKKFKLAMNVFEEADQEELDIDVACPVESRLRSGMLDKKCGGGFSGARMVTWKPRFAVLTKERLDFGSQEHALASRESSVKEKDEVSLLEACRDRREQQAR